MRRTGIVLATAVALGILLLLAGCGNATKVKEAVDKGKTAMEVGDIDAAMRAYDEALQFDPDSAEALAGRESARKAKDLQEYVESVWPVIEQVNDLSRRWDDLREKSMAGQVTDLEFGERLLDDFMPKTRDLVEKAEGLSVGISKNLRDVHEDLISALNLTLQAFSEVATAIDAGDLSRITSANKLLSDGRAAERRYVQKLEDLATEYGVKFELPKAAARGPNT